MPRRKSKAHQNPRLGTAPGSMPFALYALLFLILPTMYIVIGAFRTDRENRSPMSWGVHPRSSRASGSRSGHCRRFSGCLIGFRGRTGGDAGRPACRYADRP